MTIALSNILEILPHRYPFVMVDRVTEVVPGQAIRGYKLVSHNEPWTLGHFPAQPVFPGVLILEALAQVGGVLAHASDPFDTQANLMFVAGIDKAKFRRPVLPGDKLELSAEVLQHRSKVWKLRGEGRVDGALCSSAELLLSVVARGA